MEVYPSDLSDDEWAILELLIPPGDPGGRPREVEMRAVLNGTFYVLRSGCAWRMLPREYLMEATPIARPAIADVLQGHCNSSASVHSSPSAFRDGHLED